MVTLVDLRLAEHVSDRGGGVGVLWGSRRLRIITQSRDRVFMELEANKDTQNYHVYITIT